MTARSNPGGFFAWGIRMAFRSTESLAGQYDRIKRFAATLKTQCGSYNTSMAAGDFPIDDLVTGLLPLLVDAADRLANPPTGLANYAAGQEADETYDVVAEYTALKAAVDSAVVWIGTNAPKDDSDRVRAWTLTDAGVLARTQVTSLQTATLRTVLQAIIDQID